MKIGSEAHKQLFCRSFIESHLEYEPEQLPWPELDSLELERLRGIPFWEQALKTEQEAGAMVSAYAATLSDPLVREAITLQGKEESRHARLIEFLINHYDIKISEPPAPEIPSNIEQAFIHFGFEECFDSFFAFGMFGIARQAKYLPEPLFTIFDPILNEEARHIVFFVNWVTYLQIDQGRGAGVLRAAHALWQYGRAIRNLIQAFGPNSDGNSEDFTATGASTFIDNLTLEMFLSTSLQENARRMSAFDNRLLQPRLLPMLSKIASRSLRIVPRRQPLANAEINPSKP
ncbi:MAG: ferritin-like domain-containing protein [Xenococcaceae cyanobacterium]